MTDARAHRRPTRAVLFDDGKGELAPLTDLRASFEIRTGALTTWERQCTTLDVEPGSVCVPTALVEVAQDRWRVPVNRPPEPRADDPDGDEPVLLLNGRHTLPDAELVDSLPVGAALTERDATGSGASSAHGTSSIVVAKITLRDARALLSGGTPEMQQIDAPAGALIAKPWGWRRTRDACIAADLSILSTRLSPLDRPDGVAIVGGHSVYAHPSTQIFPSAVFDTSNGPVVLDENAVVRPQTLVQGPAYVGPGSTILDKALIKPQTAIGPVCKAAGEIGGTIFQGYANKGHDGHLGDSFVGAWCNLGAGTVNSNLLNTYAEVFAQATPGGRHERTGQTFLGCTLGDHVRTAIGTRIMTGAIIGTGTMWAAGAAVSGTLGPFGWHTDAGHGTHANIFRLAKFFEVANAAMARRGVKMSVADSRRITVLHETHTGVEAIAWPGKDRSHLEAAPGPTTGTSGASHRGPNRDSDA